MPTTKRQQRAGADTDVYGAFARRIVRAYARRVGAGDVDALPGLIGLTVELDAAITDAVNGLRGCGHSWADIAARLGSTRDRVRQRGGPPRASIRTASGRRRSPGAGQLGLFAAVSGGPEP